MATDHPTPAERATRRATVRRLAADGLSHRAIARRLGIHHNTVARDLDAPHEPTTAPPAPTSGTTPAPHLLHPLDPTLIQDINLLTDPRTGALYEPIRAILRAAATQRRAAIRAMIQHQCATTAPGR